MKKIFLIVSFILISYPCFANEIGLKISSGETWKNWGDYILGQDLKIGFEENGYSVIDSYQENYYPTQSKNTNFDVYMHGFIPFNPPKDKLNMLYLYYPLSTAQTHKYQNIEYNEPYWMSLQTELWDYQLIGVASKSYMKEINKLGIKTIFTPQFTNPNKFFYEYDEKLEYDVLFVGRPLYKRLSAIYAVEAGFNVALFGGGWENLPEKEHFIAPYIDNNILNKYYSSAKIVLNDTRQDMKDYGFINNRVFDVTACKGFLISDYMPEIEEFYGDSIPMFKNKEELKELIQFYLNNPEARKEKAQKAYEITMKHFTNKAIAKTIIDEMKIIQGQYNEK